MNPRDEKLPAGLYLVATPIGTARDITLRALDILNSADILAAEDTRSMRRLMDIHGIQLRDRPLVSYHDHNGDKIRPRLLQYMAEGKSVAYGSEAGTPLVADPGFDLARAARSEGLTVTSAPGASAVITALTIAGLPTDKFLFAGFLPNSKSQRKSALSGLKDVRATLAFYESPKRVAAMLRDAADVLGAHRPAAICRELTKKFEEVISGTLAELADQATERNLKGEIVVLIDRGDLPVVSEEAVDSKLKEALAKMSVRDAADQVSSELGMPRRAIYQRALTLEKETE